MCICKTGNGTVLTAPRGGPGVETALNASDVLRIFRDINFHPNLSPYVLNGSCVTSHVSIDGA